MSVPLFRSNVKTVDSSGFVVSQVTMPSVIIAGLVQASSRCDGNHQATVLAVVSILTYKFTLLRNLAFGSSTPLLHARSTVSEYAGAEKQWMRTTQTATINQCRRIPNRVILCRILPRRTKRIVTLFFATVPALGFVQTALPKIPTLGPAPLISASSSSIEAMHPILGLPSKPVYPTPSTSLIRIGTSIPSLNRAASTSSPFMASTNLRSVPT